MLDWNRNAFTENQLETINRRSLVFRSDDEQMDPDRYSTLSIH